MNISDIVRDYRQHAEALEAEVERLRKLLADAHDALGADGGITEHECECSDCASLRGEENPK